MDKQELSIGYIRTLFANKASCTELTDAFNAVFTAYLDKHTHLKQDSLISDIPTLIGGVLETLCYLREQGGLDLNLHEFKESLCLSHLCDLFVSNQIPLQRMGQLQTYLCDQVGILMLSDSQYRFTNEHSDIHYHHTSLIDSLFEEPHLIGQWKIEEGDYDTHSERLARMEYWGELNGFSYDF